MAYGFKITALGSLLASLLFQCICAGQEFDFAKRQQAIKARLEKSKGKVKNKAVHEPPMIKAATSDLGDAEPVIGVYLNNEARAYPLTMLFNGGGIFELLNDTCGSQPIAPSW